MDLVYMPEILSYGPLRGPVYRDYEQPWNKDYFNCGKPANAQDKPSQKPRCNQQRPEHCVLCKQNKRRPLSTYIKKNRTNSCGDISEEREETADEADDNNTSIKNNDNDNKTTELRGQNNDNNSNINNYKRFFSRFEKKC